MPIDYKKYPPNWATEIVPRIKERAGERCEICGLANGQTIHSVKIFCRYQYKKNGAYYSRYDSKQIWFRDLRDARKVKKIAQEIKPVKVVLTVAHLDHDETNHDVKDDRLMAMCQKCHLDYDAEEKYKRSLKDPAQPQLLKDPKT